MLKTRLFFFLYLAFSSICFAQTVTFAGNLNDPRWLHQSQLLNDGKVLAFGGDNGNYLKLKVYDSAEIYDPSTGTWSSTGNMTEKRANFQSIVLNNGNIMAMGGDNQELKVLSSCEVFNVSTGTWSAVTPMNKSRYRFAAVKLKDGRILVAGGLGSGKESEIYSPESNTWTNIGDMNLIHGRGLSMIVLNDGKVLATGGADAMKSAEIFDPQTGLWSLLSSNMSANRYDHNMIKLNDGSILIAGSANINQTDQKRIEIYDPQTGYFSYKTTALANIGSSPMVMTDDNKVLVYCVGNITTPTRSIQIYDPINDVMTSLNDNLPGTTSNTLHKLDNGQILILGGTATTGNGASSYCVLIGQAEFFCTPPNLLSTVSGGTVCLGKPFNLIINATENGVQYQPVIAGYIVGNMTPGGGNIYLNITSDNLQVGENVVKVLVTKPGCPPYYLADTAVINVEPSQLSKPKINTSGSTSICPGSKVFLSTPSATGYLWSNGATTNSIIPEMSGFYSVRIVDASGCTSPPSEPVRVYQITSEPTIANPNLSVCVNLVPFKITDATPLGGTWSGPGIDANGNFSPSLAGEGTHSLAYNLCNQTAFKTVSVKPLPIIPSISVKVVSDTICENNYAYFEVQNSTKGIQYSLYNENGQKLEPSQYGNGSLLTFSTPRLDAGKHKFKISSYVTNDCGTTYSDVEKVIVSLKKYPESTQILTLRDTICSGEAPVFKIINSDPTFKYRLSNWSFQTPFIQGNGDTLTLQGDVMYAGYSRFDIEVSNLLNCSNYSISQRLIVVREIVPSVSYAPSDIANDTITIHNKSNGDSYFWQFDNTASTINSTVTSPTISYTTPGEKNWQLTISTRHGCYDTINGSIFIFDLANPGNSSLCLQKEYNKNYTVTDFHMDQHNNSYITGYFLAYDRYNLFSLKADASGNIIWLKEQPFEHYTNSSFGTGITSDKYGNTYVVGNYTGYVFKLENHTIYPGNNSSKGTVPFVIKYDTKGNEKWVIYGKLPEFGTYNSAYGGDIICDENGRIFVSGSHISATFSFVFPQGNSTYIDSDRDAFLMEIDTEGAFKKNIPFGGNASYNSRILSLYYVNTSPSPETALGVNPKLKFNNAGDVIVAGVYAAQGGSFMLGEIELKNTEPILIQGSNTYSFIGEYNKNSGWTNAFKVSRHGMDYIQELAIDKEDNIILTGHAFNYTIINGDSISLPENVNYSYLTKIKKNGDFIWNTLSRHAQIRDIAVTGNNSILVTGFIDATGGLYPASSTSYPTAGFLNKGSRDYFLGEYSEDGKILWAESKGGPLADWPYYMETDACGDPYIFASIGTEYTFEGYGNLHLTKFSIDGNCKKEDCITLSTRQPVFSNEIAEIFPNPASDQVSIKIKAETSEPLKISLLNIVGEIILEKTEQRSSFTQLDLNRLNAGNYVLKIETKDSIQTEKIVIIK